MELHPLAEESSTPAAASALSPATGSQNMSRFLGGESTEDRKASIISMPDSSSSRHGSAQIGDSGAGAMPPQSPTEPYLQSSSSTAGTGASFSVRSMGGTQGKLGRSISRAASSAVGVVRSAMPSFGAAGSHVSARDGKIQRTLKMPKESERCPKELAGQRVRLTVDLSDRMTIHWDEVRDAGGPRMRKGSCHLFSYPQVQEQRTILNSPWIQGNHQQGPPTSASPITPSPVEATTRGRERQTTVNARANARQSRVSIVSVELEPAGVASLAAIIEAMIEQWFEEVVVYDEGNLAGSSSQQPATTAAADASNGGGTNTSAKSRGRVHTGSSVNGATGVQPTRQGISPSASTSSSSSGQPVGRSPAMSNADEEVKRPGVRLRLKPKASSSSRPDRGGDDKKAAMVDRSGAHLIHCLVVANNEASLDLAERLFELRPRLLLDVHTSVPGSKDAIFEGEGTLHILAVNDQRERLCRILKNAHAKLADFEFLQILSQQATGPFFHRTPMCSFGVTPVAYFASFKLKEVLILLFGDRNPEGIDLYDPRNATKGLLTEVMAQRLMNGDLAFGQPINLNVDRPRINMYSPLHAVVASNQPEMFDFLIEKCGAIAEPDYLEPPGSEHREPPSLRDHYGCTPLQLAARLGLQRMVKRMLWQRTKCIWTWGPVSERHIPLDEIDSANSRGERTVMELICHSSASEEAQRLLLDEFMHGFFFELFKEKWSKFGRWFFLVRLMLHCTYVLLLTLIASPSILKPVEGLGWNRDLAESLTAVVVHLVLSIVLLFSECNEIVLSLLSTETSAASKSTLAKLGGFSWNRVQHMWRRLVGAAKMVVERGGQILLPSAVFSIVSCFTLLFDCPLNLSNRTSGDDGSGDGSGECEIEAAERATVRTCLAVAAFTGWVSLLTEMYKPYENPATFVNIVARVLKNDVFKFILIYVPLLFGFATAINTLLRGSDSESRWADWFYTVENLLLLSFIQEPPDIFEENDPSPSSFMNLLNDTAYDEIRTEHQWEARMPTALFFVLFVFFLLLTVVLLINLLIAMLSARYSDMSERATTDYRIAFARLVLRFERLAEQASSLFGKCKRLVRRRDANYQPSYNKFTQVGKLPVRKDSDKKLPKVYQRYQSFRQYQRDPSDEPFKRSLNYQHDTNLFVDEDAERMMERQQSREISRRGTRNRIDSVDLKYQANLDHIQQVVNDNLELKLRSMAEAARTATQAAERAAAEAGRIADSAAETAERAANMLSSANASTMASARPSCAGGTPGGVGSRQPSGRQIGRQNTPPDRTSFAALPEEHHPSPNRRRQGATVRPRNESDLAMSRAVDRVIRRADVDGDGELDASELLSFYAKVLRIDVIQESHKEEVRMLMRELAGEEAYVRFEDDEEEEDDDSKVPTKIDGALLKEWALKIRRQEGGEAARPVHALLIIDVQNDFISGSLALSGCPAGQDGEEVVEVINNLREARFEDKSIFDVVALSLDWHPKEHCSFHETVTNGTEHPDVVVFHPSEDQDAAMAKSPFDKVLLVEPPKDGEDVDAEPKPMTQVLWPRHCVQHEIGSMTHGDLITTESDIVVYKGTNPRVDSYSAFYDNARLGTPLTKDGRSLLHELRSKGVTHVHICGLATDVCVAYTAFDALEAGFATTVIEDGCRGVSEEEIDRQFNEMERAGIQIVTADQAVGIIESKTLREALSEAIDAERRAEYGRQYRSASGALPSHGEMTRSSHRVSDGPNNSYRASLLLSDSDRNSRSKSFATRREVSHSAAPPRSATFLPPSQRNRAATSVPSAAPDVARMAQPNVAMGGRV